MSGVNSSEIRKVAQCVYLACEESIAADIAVKCKRIADAYDSNQELIAKQAERIEGQLKALEVAGKRIAQLEGVESKLQADNELLRGLFKPLTYELQACQNVLHSLAHNGQVCWDYSVDAKKVLESTELALSATAKGGSLTMQL